MEGILNGNELGDIVPYLQSELKLEKLEQVQHLVDRLVALMNNTRQWILKGYTPKELASRERKSLRPLPEDGGKVIDFRTKQKVGRNDPCPCGSGKKFKKCCGR
ncbi:SEC-C metal-binding domain-containing protein [Ammoniphilus sp. 3BR4]|uniref:SEC-C metal-binding domain-containing protein n=1 Tax=Ammoniphilus sp. 3BR4 TaxID=3158265 RepID=UPI0034676EBE